MTEVLDDHIYHLALRAWEYAVIVGLEEAHKWFQWELAAYQRLHPTESADYKRRKTDTP